MTGVPAGWSRTGPDIVSEVEMVSTNWNGSFLIVEGASDECFFSPRVAETVYIVDATGKLNVEAAFEIFDADPIHASTVVLGVVDEDYDWLTGHVVASSNIIKFDPRDLEGMLLRSTALGGVLAEFGDKNAIRVFEAANGPVQTALLRRAEVFGRIRMYNASNRKVCLKKFKPQRFCNVASWSYDVDAALQTAVDMGVDVDVASLSANISTLRCPTPWHGVRGHDLIDILVGGLLGVLGRKGNVSGKEVERLLRQGMHAHEFHASGLFARLSAWQVRKGVTYM